MAASTWTWVGASSDPTQPSNWDLTAGSGNPADLPQPGDTAIFTGAGATPSFVDQTVSAGSTFELTGSGAVAFVNNTTLFSNGSIDPAGVIAVTGSAASMSIDGPFENNGQIQVEGADSSLTITVGNGPPAGLLDNAGTISVASTDHLTIVATSSAAFSGLGSVVVAGGSALIDGNLSGSGQFAISNGGSLEIDQTGSAGLPEINFQGSGTLKLDQPADFAGMINEFSLGDTIDLGVLNIATVITENNGEFIALNSSGGTVFVAQSSNGALADNTGTFVMSSTGGLAGDVLITEGSGDTSITALGASVWQWNGASASAQTPADWTLVSGPGNGFGYPQAGDTAIAAAGTIILGNINLNANTIEVGGTAGTAALLGTGSNSASLGNPSLDPTSVITSAVPGNTTPESTLLSAPGLFVNEGTIEADGPSGSSFTITVSTALLNGTVQPGYFFNYNQILVDAGNSMTIDVGGTAEFYNASAIFVDGGTLDFNAAVDAVTGGYAPGAGVIVIEGDGTVETNVGYAADVTGDIPVYAFDSSTAGATLKIDNIGSFGGEILGFSQGDTIDVGTSLAVTQLAYDNLTGILYLENNQGSVLASLLFASGNFASGTQVVNDGTAGSFIVGTAADGDTIITTNVQNHTDAASSGSWQTGSLWSNGTPGTFDTAIIGSVTGGSTVVVNTGASAVTVGAVVITGNDTSLQITSDTTVSSYPVRNYGGTIEVTGGETLTAPQLSMVSGTLELDPGSVVNLTGHVTYGNTGAINNLITASATDPQAMQLNSGDVLVNGATIEATQQAGGVTGGRIFVGYEGGGVPATMTVEGDSGDAAVVTDDYSIISSDPASFGVLTLNGNVSWTDEELLQADTETTRGYMVVGYNNQAGDTGTVTPPAFSGTATLTVENGATLIEQTYAIIGDTSDSAGTALVTDALWNIGTATGGFLDVGKSGDGTLTVGSGGTIQLGGSLNFVNNGSSQSVGGIGVGVSATGTGTLTVEDGGLITEDAGMNAGVSGSGLVEILNGGTIQLTGTNGINVGASAGSFGTLIVGGTDAATGASALVDIEASGRGLSVGAVGNGTVEVESGGTIELNGTGALAVGQSLHAVGLLTVSGPNALVDDGTASTGLGVGVDGAGTVDVLAGGTIEVTATGHNDGIGIGQTAGIAGLVEVSGNQSLLLEETPNAGMAVGQSGSGTLEVNSGGTVSITEGQGLNIATASGGSGTVDVAGGTIDTNSLTVGGSSNGQLTISAGGLVSAGVINLGFGSPGHGTVSVAGTGAELASSGSLFIGDAGSGSVTIGAGASLQVAGNVEIGSTPGGSGTLAIADAGGTVTLLGNINVGTSSAGTLTVGAGSTVQLDNGGLNAGADAVLNLASPFDAPKFASNAGAITISGNDNQTYLAYLANTGNYTIGQGVTHTLETPVIDGTGGTISIGGANAELVLNSDTVTGQTIGFTAATGTLVIGIDQLSTIDVPPNGTGEFTTIANPNFGVPSIGGFDGTISNFVQGDTIIVETTLSAGFALDGSQIAVVQNSVTLGALTFTSAAQAQSAFNSGDVINQVACFAAGTRIETERGTVLVEALREGDRVLTAGDGRLEPIVWIGHRSVDCGAHPQPKQVWPVRVMRGAFGAALPRRDLLLSPDHAVFINDVLVPVKYLINGTSITQVQQRSVTYYHVELPRHDLLLAEGLAVDSYLDVGDRSDFANGGGVTALFPNFTSLKWETEGCAPLVVTGPDLDAARAWLRERDQTERDVGAPSSRG